MATKVEIKGRPRIQATDGGSYRQMTVAQRMEIAAQRIEFLMQKIDDLTKQVKNLQNDVKLKDDTIHFLQKDKERIMFDVDKLRQSSSSTTEDVSGVRLQLKIKEDTVHKQQQDIARYKEEMKKLKDANKRHKSLVNAMAGSDKHFSSQRNIEHVQPDSDMDCVINVIQHLSRVLGDHRNDKIERLHNYVSEFKQDSSHKDLCHGFVYALGNTLAELSSFSVNRKDSVPTTSHKLRSNPRVPFNYTGVVFKRPSHANKSETTMHNGRSSSNDKYNSEVLLLAGRRSSAVTFANKHNSHNFRAERQNSTENTTDSRPVTRESIRHDNSKGRSPSRMSSTAMNSRPVTRERPKTRERPRISKQVTIFPSARERQNSSTRRPSTREKSAILRGEDPYCDNRPKTRGSDSSQHIHFVGINKGTVLPGLVPVFVVDSEKAK